MCSSDLELPRAVTLIDEGLTISKDYGLRPLAQRLATLKSKISSISPRIPFELTRRGAIRATIEGKVRTPDRALVAHIDTLGAMVKWLKDNGRLAIVSIGNWSSRFAEGARVTVFTDSGLHRGTILPIMTSGHTYGEKINSQPVSWENKIGRAHV